jgi:LysR family glycine cleavage system transcriptional activator
VELSEKGRAYLPELTQALNLLAGATEQLLNDGVAGPLRITALPSFAHKWLLPRLCKFKSDYPDIDLIVETSADSKDLANRQFDLAICSGTGRWRGMHAELIADEWLAPMCSPTLLDPASPIASAADLLRYPLLHDTPKDGWSRWLHSQGIASSDQNRGYAFYDSAMVLQAAVDGLGIAMGRILLAKEDLASGKLWMPHSASIKNDFSYWLVTPQNSAKPARIAAFRHWLLAEASASTNAS